MPARLFCMLYAFWIHHSEFRNPNSAIKSVAEGEANVGAHIGTGLLQHLFDGH